MSSRDKFVALDMWEKLLKSSEFKVVEEYKENRINILNKEIAILGSSPSQDNAIKITALLNRIDEINTFFQRVKFQKSEIIKNKEK